MAATAQSSTPPFFNFLKEGLLLPTRNRRLFAAVFALIVASSSLLLLGNDLAVKPLTDEIRADAVALNGTDPSSPEFLHLIQEIQDDTRKIMIAGAVYGLAAVVVGSVVRVLVLFAAVATYSGELNHTFGSLLGRARAQLKGPLLTLAFVYVLEISCFTLLAAMGGLLTFLVTKQQQHLALLLVVSLLAMAAAVFAVYFFFVCSLSVVVAVDEPGCRGAGAVGRAWRLVKGKRLRAVVFVLVTFVLSAAVWPVYNLAKTRAVSDMAAGLLMGFLYTILMAAVGLFATCAMTAFYYECKESAGASATEYIKYVQVMRAARLVSVQVKNKCERVRAGMASTSRLGSRDWMQGRALGDSHADGRNKKQGSLLVEPMDKNQRVAGLPVWTSKRGVAPCVVGGPWENKCAACRWESKTVGCGSVRLGGPWTDVRHLVGSKVVGSFGSK